MSWSEVVRQRRNLLRRILSIALPVVVVYLAIQRIDFEAFVDLLREANWGLLGIGYALGMIVFLLRAIRWVDLLSRFGVFMGVLNVFLMCMVEIFFNNLVSGLSVTVRGVYLGDRIPGLGEKFRLLFFDKLYDWVIPWCIAIVSFPYVLFQWPTRTAWIVWIGLIGALPLVIYRGGHILAISERRAWPRTFDWFRARVLHRIPLHLDGIDRRMRVRLFLFSLFGFVVYYLTLFIMAQSFSLPITLTDLIMLDAVATMAVVIPLNFAGVGTRDVALVGLLSFYGCSPEPIALFILALVIYRLFLSGIGWSSMYLLHKRGYPFIGLSGRM